MTEMLVERKEDLNRLGRLLVDLHTVATDIGVEVLVHKEKLKNIDENILDA